MLSGIPSTHSDGHVFFAQGDSAADLYIVRSGTVRIVRTTDAGEIVELATLGAGEVFGEMGLFAPGPRSATAVASGEVEIEVIDRPAFLASIDDPIVLQILEKMSERLRRMDEMLDIAHSADDPPPPVV